MTLPHSASGKSERELALTLLSAHAVRERAHEMAALCEAGRLDHWRIDRGKLPATADYVVDTIRKNYPTLDIPFHARWRHFAAGGVDRWAALEALRRWPDEASLARAAFDLAIVSVLLDAGAGPDWRYRLEDGSSLARSEGLAVASLEMFARGAFSADPRDKLRADASRLAAIDASDLADGFKVTARNPLVGLEGRAALLRALGRAALDAPSIFGKMGAPRPGGLFDHLVDPRAKTVAIPASAILEAVLTHLGPIWPSRLSLGGVGLGDCWRHPALRRPDATDGLIPFHKLSQWLSYSLIEPLQWAGAKVTGIDALTGLPEYRNGGLFIDFGVLALQDPGEASSPQEPASPLVVEWRALTVALLDEIATLIRRTLRLDAASLPLAKVLEGGTWAAGRRIAREKRADGSPPLTIVSDGTVF
ncbi:MAG: URC4/urg3 family protein [Hyphomicrobiales bacterium]